MIYGSKLPNIFFQAEDGIRDVERSRGLGDVYKRQYMNFTQLMLRVLLKALELIKQNMKNLAVDLKI